MSLIKVRRHRQAEEGGFSAKTEIGLAARNRSGPAWSQCRTQQQDKGGERHEFQDTVNHLLERRHAAPAVGIADVEIGHGVMQQKATIISASRAASISRNSASRTGIPTSESCIRCSANSHWSRGGLDRGGSMAEIIRQSRQHPKRQHGEHQDQGGCQGGGVGHGPFAGINRWDGVYVPKPALG